MKKFFIVSLIFIIIYFMLIFLIPWGFYSFFVQKTDLSVPITVKSYIANANETREFPLEEYLIGVVGAEMPATFPLDALKAQAVAARTHIVSKISEGGSSAPEHHGGDVCTNPAHCKAWKSKKELFAAWGENCEDYYEKVTKAVEDTKGEIILYDGKPISAVYYSMSSGNTENSEDVWGGEVPYLKSVSSTFDENAPGFSSAASFTAEEFARVLKEENPLADFSGSPSSWSINLITSEGGGVVTAEIAGAEFKGTRIRTLFGLRSHNFTIEITEDNIVIFNVKGYGHGVGMSQWGCKFLAEDGKHYTDILKYYYTGVTIKKV